MKNMKKVFWYAPIELWDQFGAKREITVGWSAEGEELPEGAHIISEQQFTLRYRSLFGGEPDWDFIYGGSV